MTNSYLLLMDEPEIFDRCPNCGAEPFESMMRGLVIRFSWFKLRKRIWAVICGDCKDIVDWEACKKTEKEYELERGLGIHDA